MLSNAWYTVNYFQVSFGQQDLIQDAVRQLKDMEGITIDEQRQVITDRLLHPQHAQTTRLLFHFDKQVPHWFLSPWYPGKTRREIYELSQAGIDQPLYSLYKDRIVIGEEGLFLHRHRFEGWIVPGKILRCRPVPAPTIETNRVPNPARSHGGFVKMGGNAGVYLFTYFNLLYALFSSSIIAGRCL